MKKDIRKLVNYYIKKYNTRNPFEIADFLNIELQIGPLGTRSGFYMYLKKHKCIFLNNTLSKSEMQLVMAHELAHAIMHTKQNCYFIKNSTLLLNSKTEKEANLFAAELLVPDSLIVENPDYSINQLSIISGYVPELIELKLELLFVNN